MIRRSKIIFALCTFFCSIYPESTNAQALNINGDTILVNMEAEVQIMFPAAPQSYSTDPVNANYRIWEVNTGIYFIAGSENPQPVILKISEGDRNHRFVLQFKKGINNSEAKLYYDFSTVKKLAEHLSQNSFAQYSEKGLTNKEQIKPGKKSKKSLAAEKPANPSAYSALPKLPAEDSTVTNYKPANLNADEGQIASPTDKIPLPKVKEAKNKRSKKQKLAQQDDDEKKYIEVIIAARVALEQKNYLQAQAAYNQALELKPGDVFATHQLGKINALLPEATANSEVQKSGAVNYENTAGGEKSSSGEQLINSNYDTTIKAADVFFKAGDYANAKIQYTKALAFIKRDWPVSQLAIINKMQKEAIVQASADYNKPAALPNITPGINTKSDSAVLNPAELKKKYILALSNGKSSYLKEDFLQAKLFYEEAINLLPSEAEPKNQLHIINNKLDDIAREAAFNENYERITTLADSQIIAKNYSSALATYTEASMLKPLESYPKKQIKYIQFELARIEKKKKEELAQRYQDALTRADKAVADKQYAEAKSLYAEALGIHGDNEYAKRRLEIISYQLEKERLEKLSREAVKPVAVKKSRRKKSS